PTDHPLHLGSYLYPLRYPAEIDLFLNLGAKMPDQGAGAPLVPRAAKIIHGRIESSQIGVNYPTDVAVVGDVGETARALVQAVKSLVPADRLAALRLRRFDETKAATDAFRAAYIASARDQWNASPITWPRLMLSLNE